MSKVTANSLCFIDVESIGNKFTFNDVVIQDSHSFDLKIEFSQPIISFRNHDYTWVDVAKDRMANDFSPKILQLQNGLFIQANTHAGIWEVHPENPSILWWRFNPEFAAPITEYRTEINTKQILSAESELRFQEDLALLISKNNAVELSRSPIPFSAVACFTDHCDYDTAENLKIQRDFFKGNGIKTTKGFFLNHFSKRDDNASYQNEKAVLDQWRNDGHELCYHSLTQSIRTDQEAFQEFENFTPPYDDIPVWIDHGFQPYNFSLFEKNNISKEHYEKTLSDKNIVVLWNYIDAGNATTGIINQLNAEQFNLSQYALSIKGKSFLKRMVLLVKNIIFHYDNDEYRVRNYIDTLTYTKALLQKKKVTAIFKLIKNLIPIVLVSLKVLFTWKKVKKTTYKVAKYSPIFFKHKIHEKEFYVFQTVEMVDFITALSKQNVDSLIDESGLFIAHTYFSVNMKHYAGKLINGDGSLNEKVVQNFNYLAEKIQQKTIWNPTLSQLLEVYKNYQNTIFDIDEKGTIFIKNNFNIPSRNVS